MFRKSGNRFSEKNMRKIKEAGAHHDSTQSGCALAPTSCSRDTMPSLSFTLRRYTPADEDAAIELWRRTWQLAYPQIDFTARLDWWRERWRSELVATAAITVAEAEGKLVGFVTVDADSFDLDQIVVSPEAWGTGIASALIAEAKRLSPNGLD